MNKIAKFKIYLSPAFITSLFFLILTLLIYKISNLRFHPYLDIKSIVLILAFIVFLVISFFIKMLFSLNRWSNVWQLFTASFQQTLDFVLKMLPFFIFLYVYDSIHDITHLINAREFDNFLIKIDSWLLGGNNISLLFQKIISPWRTVWFSFAYGFYFIYFFINPIVFYFFKKGKYFDNLLMAVILTNFIGLIGYIAVPCLGPIVAEQHLFTKELITPSGLPYASSGDIATAYVFSRGSFHCFPSLHFGVSFVWLYFAWRYLRKAKYWNLLFYLELPLIVSLWLSTLYLRWHYLTDLLGGLVVALAGLWLAGKIIKKEKDAKLV